jgi:glucan phosphoethanolaminetransferase (alkaline phosphatase superfamily)
MGLFFSWIVSLVIMLGGVFFAYDSLKDAIQHVKSYRDEKAEKKLLWWYLEWTFLILNLLFSKHIRRSSLIFALFFFSLGAIVFVITTIRGLAYIFGFNPPYS